MLLVESGNRINTTEFEWPKNLMPSGFSMKVSYGLYRYMWVCAFVVVAVIIFVFDTFT